MNDLVIRGALIVDGSGSEPATGDVAVLDGVISAVGKHGLTGTQLVDGSGLVLAPGIVDIHTHYDAQLTWDASASPSPQMGVRWVTVALDWHPATQIIVILRLRTSPRSRECRWMRC